MELCLQQLKRDVHHKEVRVSECFMKQTMVLSRVMNEFTKNDEILELVGRFYDLQNEWDALTMSMAQIEVMRDEKVRELEHLQADYRALENSELDKKLALGQKIASLRLELDKGIVEKLTKMRGRKMEIVREMNLVNERIRFITAEYHKKYEIPKEDADKIEDELSDGNIEDLQEQINHLAHQLKEKYQIESSESMLLDGVVQVDFQVESHDGEGQLADSSGSELDPYTPPALTALDTEELRKYIHQSERWRNYTFSIGWELKSMKEMLVKCDDATIKVRRLVHNFEQRMERTRNDVWDENYNLKPDFDFKDISVAGLQDIILLHDFWAANALDKKPEDLEMTLEEFMAFRRRCNKVSYNLRKNQYAQLLAVKIDRTERRIQELGDILANRDTLHWDDKYGEEGRKDDDEVWSIDDIQVSKKAKIHLIAIADAVIQEQPRKVKSVAKPSKSNKIHDIVKVEKELLAADKMGKPRSVPQNKTSPTSKSTVNGIVSVQRELEQEDKARTMAEIDSKKLVERTVKYLRDLGLVKSEKDIEGLVLRNVVSQNKDSEVVKRGLVELEVQKTALDDTIGIMKSHRKDIQGILDSVAKIENKIADLKKENAKIQNFCMKQGPKPKGIDKQIRTKMLLDKVANEQKIMELKSMAKKAKNKHLSDFTALEKLRRDVDKAQESYDQKVREFKENIGLDEEAVKRLMVGIYNKFQDEILEHNNKGKRK